MDAQELAKLATLTTEARNEATANLDSMSTLDMLTVINDEDAKVSLAVRAVLPEVAKAIDAISERFARGGRLFYIGAGTSGRLGVLDASECPPTFNVSADLVQGLIAGGDRALRLSSEHSEDSREEGAKDLAATGFGKEDTLVGIAASGRTPYVLGAMEWAREQGALVVGLSCVADSAVARAADIALTPVPGPEVLTGSTRLKAGTATKLVLNMLSTGVMVRTGAVYGNLMVNVRATNEKLVDRAERIVAAATGASPEAAAQALRDASMSVKTAIVMLKLGINAAEAETELNEAGGVLRKVIG